MFDEAGLQVFQRILLIVMKYCHRTQSIRIIPLGIYPPGALVTWYLFVNYVHHELTRNLLRVLQNHLRASVYKRSRHKRKFYAMLPISQVSNFVDWHPSQRGESDETHTPLGLLENPEVYEISELPSLTTNIVTSRLHLIVACDRKALNAVKTCQWNGIYETTRFTEQYSNNYKDMKSSARVIYLPA